jgi:hypothetical protein
MHRKYFALAANTVFSDFEGNSLNFVKNWLKETGMENLCASFEGMYYIIVACTKTRNNRNETTGTRIGKDRNHRNQNRTRNSTSLTSPGLITKSKHLLQRDLYFPHDFTNLRYRNGKRGRHGKAKQNKAIFFSNLHEDSTICLLNSIR